MPKVIKTLKPIIALLAWSFSVTFAIAGTSQIFSPAGLPRSSTQDYSIPDTTVPIQTFPSPPIPMGDMSLPGLGSVPLREELTTNGLKTPPSVMTEQKNLNTPTNSANVESFFQCVPLPQAENIKSTNKNKSRGLAPGKLLWHTLDNIGVPLPVGKGGDLAPELSRPYVAIPQHISDQSSTKLIPQKIPASELGVTDIPANHDAKLH